MPCSNIGKNHEGIQSNRFKKRKSFLWIQLFLPPPDQHTTDLAHPPLPGSIRDKKEKKKTCDFLDFISSCPDQNHENQVTWGTSDVWHSWPSFFSDWNWSGPTSKESIRLWSILIGTLKKMHFLDFQLCWVESSLKIHLVPSSALKDNFSCWLFFETLRERLGLEVKRVSLTSLDRRRQVQVMGGRLHRSSTVKNCKLQSLSWSWLHLAIEIFDGFDQRDKKMRKEKMDLRVADSSSSSSPLSRRRRLLSQPLEIAFASAPARRPNDDFKTQLFGSGVYNHLHHHHNNEMSAITETSSRKAWNQLIQRL